ncbi:hypothetical protein QBC43DRAFT_59962 [Cladorrhinum sp. PSN259]|nr:hypothetical protein QBC43DRAFT_59962 [Cladorrhinum sp. PSN259]
MSVHDSLEERRKIAGFSDLHIDILEDKISDVKRILTSDSCKDQLQFRDFSRTTPLMTAVLVGRFEVVCRLLSKGASTRVKDIFDNVALDYARSTPFVKWKLNSYAKLGFRLPEVSHRERRRISETLRYPAALWSCRHIGSHVLSRSYIFKDSNKLRILNASKSSVFYPGKKDADLIVATSGFIASVVKDSSIEQAAISGWMPNKGRGTKVLDNERYTQLVRDIACLWGIKLQKSMRDNGSFAPLPEHRGRFAACHIEKKLTVWWVEKVMNKVLGTTNPQRMGDLRKVSLTRDLSEAKLYLDHRPCHDCWRFLFRIYRLTGIRIRVETIKFVVEGKRVKPSSGCANCQCESCLRKQDGDQPLARAPVSRMEQQLDVDDDADGELSDGEPNIRAPLHPAFAASLQGMMPASQTGQRNARGELIVTEAPRHWTSFSSAPADKRPCAKPLLKPAPRGMVIYPSSQQDNHSEARVPASTIKGRSAYFENSSASTSPVGSVCGDSSGSKSHTAIHGRPVYQGTRISSVPVEEACNINPSIEEARVSSQLPPTPAPAWASRASSVLSAICSITNSTPGLARFMYGGGITTDSGTTTKGSVLSERLRRGQTENGHGLGRNGKDHFKKKTVSATTVAENHARVALSNDPKSRAAARARREEKLRYRSVFARAYHGQHGLGGI